LEAGDKLPLTMASDEPTYEELLEENYELHEEKRALSSRIQGLETDLAEHTGAGRESERRASEIGRLEKDLADATAHSHACKREIEKLKTERDMRQREHKRLETALQDKEERLSSILRGGVVNSVADEDIRQEDRQMHLTYERNLLEADQENEQIRAEMSTLESQVLVLQGALAVTAAERDEILAIRERNDVALEHSETKIEELNLLLEEARVQIQELSAERDAIDDALQATTKVVAQNEQKFRAQLEDSLVEIAKLRDTATLDNQEKMKQVQLELERAYLDAGRLDAENVELTVLADLLRNRIRDLESGHEHESILARRKHPDTGDISAELSSTKVSLYESKKKQHRIESEISGLEAELADDRDLLDIAAQQGGIGVAEAIRRNKWLKTVLRKRETEIEKCRLELSATREENESARIEHKMLKTALGDAGKVLLQMTAGAGHLSDVCPADAKTMAARCIDLASSSHLQKRSAAIKDEAGKADTRKMQVQINDLESERARLLSQLHEAAPRVSGQGIRFIGLTDENLRKLQLYAMRLSRGVEDIPIDAKCLRNGLETLSDVEPKSPALSEVCGELPKSKAEEHVRHLPACASSAGASSAIDTATIIPSSAQTPGHSTTKSNKAVHKNTSVNQPRARGTSCTYGGVSTPNIVVANLGHTETGPCDTNFCKTAIFGDWDGCPVANDQHVFNQPRLPNDIWARDLRWAHAALAEALELLDVSERECIQLGLTCGILSGQASEIRQNMSACYDVHLRKKRAMESKTSALRSKLAALQEQKAILEAKLQIYERIPGSRQVTVTRNDIGAPQSRFQEVARQMASYEVNELQMKRRHAILHEELKTEKIRRGQAENALSEVEATLRSRILYLELWKQGSVARIERLQAELDESSPNLLNMSAHSPITLQEKSSANEMMVLRASLRKLNEESAATRRDCTRLQELASIATMQAAELRRKQSEDAAEQKNDLIRIRQLEARSDNDRIIGKLQREIISTRTMYRLFARKYEAIHTELAHRERLMLKAESRRNRCDELLISLREEKQLQLDILNTTLRCAFCLPHSSTSRHTIAGVDHESEMSCKLLGLQDATNQQELELRASELAREKLEHRNAQLEIDLDTSKRLALCLTGSLASQGQRITLHFSVQDA
jgi:hypothetical protein